MATKKRGRKAPAKAARPPKFVHIAAAPHSTGWFLWALDEVGVVWTYDYGSSGWVALSTNRVQ